MSREEAAAYYGGFSDQELCMSYLTADPINIYQSDRRAEINKRRLDCSPWASMARLKYEQERATWDAAYGAVDSLKKSSGTTQSSSYGKMTCHKRGEETGGANKQCFYNCVGNLVVQTIGRMELCPIVIYR